MTAAAACGDRDGGESGRVAAEREANQRLSVAIGGDPINWSRVRAAVDAGATEVPSAALDRLVRGVLAAPRRNQVAESLAGLGDERLALALLQSARSSGGSASGRVAAVLVAARLEVSPPHRVAASMRSLANDGLIPVATLHQALGQMGLE